MLRKLLVLTAAIAAIAGCAGMSTNLLSGVNLSAPAIGGVAPGALAAGPVDFKSDEVLVTERQGDPVHHDYYLAKVLTPASPATKNQAEVIYVHNGTKVWVNAIVPSHKAAKAEIAVGKALFFLGGGYGDNKDVSDDTYRKVWWGIARVTSIDEMFKDVVEFGGEKVLVQNIRVPDKPIQ
jgi:hypothetical protein